MATGDCHANVDMVGRQAGQVVFTHLDYFHGVAIADASSEIFANLVYTVIWSLLQVRLTPDFTLDEIRVDINNNPSPPDPVPFTLTVNEPGTNGFTETLPPQATVRFIKFPNNTTLEPPTATPFKKGRTSFSSVPEPDQDNGLMVTAQMIPWQAVADVMEQLTPVFGSGPAVFTIGMFRAAGVIPAEPLAKVEVSALSVSQIVGSQNTRKR